MPISELQYPAGPPEVNGVRLTVDHMLQNPTLLQRVYVAPPTNYLSTLLFRQGTTGDSGAVIYGRAKAEDLFPSRGSVQQVEPLAEFPLVDSAPDELDVAVATKFGAAFITSDEAVQRNSYDVLARGTQKINAAMAKQDAYRVLKAFYDGGTPVVSSSASDWQTPKAFRTDVRKAVAQIASTQLGYTANTVAVHPDTATDILLLDELQNFAPRENTALNPLYRSDMANLLGLNWVTNPFMSRDEAIVLTQQAVGQNLIERPTTTETDRIVTRQGTIVIVSRRSVPIVDQPQAAVIIRGINGGVA